MTWRPSIGAWYERSETCFRVWAPTSGRVVLAIERDAAPPVDIPCQPAGDGYFTARVPGLPAGTRYRYRLDGRGPFPDPASRSQPDGVHGASGLVDPDAFAWTDAHWKGRRREDLVVYELHVGTFSPEGTFEGTAARLPHLADLGITAVELMPVADFAGTRNWGYDGAALFAPARCYGTPDALRRLVDVAHALGLAVLLDVVYNHLGPDGAYAFAFSPYYFNGRHKTPWGHGVNVDGAHSRPARDFFIENALHWVHEYHLDGLRLDATHAIADESPTHLLAELTSRVRGSVRGREVLLIAEDHRNLARFVKAPSAGGYGLDAVWADDFHHQVRRLLAGDHESYYRDATGTTRDLATTIAQGWYFTGQHSVHLGRPRGEPTTGLDYDHFVVCVQNHDQVGNRAFGERLHHEVDPAAWRAATALLLAVPETPLLFMGQEWAASTPFLFFTDHHDELGRQVTEGRRREFRAFSAFRDPAARARIPDPQALDTFLASKLRWEEREREPHASVLRGYRALLALRGREPALRDRRRDRTSVVAVNEEVVALRRDAEDARSLLIVVCLRGSASVTLASPPMASLATPGDRPSSRWVVVFTTEDPGSSLDPLEPGIDDRANVRRIAFGRPGAVILGLAA